MRSTACALALVVALGASVPAARAEDGTPRFKLVEVAGAVRVRDGATLTAGQAVAADATLQLGPGGRARIATLCGAIVAVEGPREGTPGDLLGTPAAVDACPDAGGDPRKALRRKLILSFLDRAPERIFRGSGPAAPVDPLRVDLEAPPAACFAAGRPVVIAGSVERLGDTLEIRNEAGEQALTFFDASLSGWPWPQDLPVAAGAYTVATRLHEVRIDLRALADGSAKTGPDLALALTEAGCFAQAHLLLGTLPPDREIGPAP